MLSTRIHPSTLDGHSLRNQVANRLIIAVAVGDYEPGARLPSERELAQMLGVARVTVRSAIADLIEAGLLYSRQGKGGGTFIVQLDTPASADALRQTMTALRERIVDQHTAEAWLHGTVAAAAAENHREDDRNLLAQRLEECRQVVTGMALQKADERLHEAIANATHNDALKNTLFALERYTHVYAQAHPGGLKTGWHEFERQPLRDHERLIAAILARDVAAAHEVGREHAKINLYILEATLKYANYNIWVNTEESSAGRYETSNRTKDFR